MATERDHLISLIDENHDTPSDGTVGDRFRRTMSRHVAEKTADAILSAGYIRVPDDTLASLDQAMRYLRGSVYFEESGRIWAAYAVLENVRAALRALREDTE